MFINAGDECDGTGARALMAIGLSVLLIAFAFARQPSGDASSVRGKIGRVRPVAFGRQTPFGRSRSRDGRI
jgi:hypothetical protein